MGTAHATLPYYKTFEGLPKLSLATNLVFCSNI